MVLNNKITRFHLYTSITQTHTHTHVCINKRTYKVCFGLKSTGPVLNETDLVLYQ